MSSFREAHAARARVAVGVLAMPLLGWACSGEEAKLGALPATEDADAAPPDAGEPETPPSTTLDASDGLPGTEFVFALTDSVYIDLSGPRVVTGADRSSTNWDLHFDALEVFTNSGAAGPGEGASFGPTSELELLFDTAPDVPMRADVSDGAMANWYWFAQDGLISRFRVYGVRDGDGRFFKLQVLSYYSDTEPHSEGAGVYSVRFAEVTASGTSDTTYLSGIDGRAGGVTIPAGAGAGCIDLASKTHRLLTKDEWLARDDWHVCFQRTEAFVNGGLSGPAAVAVVDLEQDPNAPPDPVSSEEATRTADNDRDRFESIDYAALTDANLTWERQYEVRPRIGTNWLLGDGQTPLPGSWIVRGADGLSHYTLYFTAITSESTAGRQVHLQVKPLH